MQTVRAALTNALIRALSDLPEATWAKIRKSVPPSELEEVQAELPIAWVSMAFHMKLSEAALAELGDERFVEVFRRTMESTLARPLMANFMNLTMGIFGLSPTAVLRRVSQLSDLVTKGSGTITYESGDPSSASLLFSHFPAEFSDECYALGLKGCLLAVVESCRVKARIELVPLGKNRAWRINVRW